MNENLGLLGLIALILTAVAGWFTHIISCLITGKYMLLIAGALVPPVGVIHGIGLWFGITW